MELITKIKWNKALQAQSDMQQGSISAYEEGVNVTTYWVYTAALQVNYDFR